MRHVGCEASFSIAHRAAGREPVGRRHPQGLRAQIHQPSDAAVGRRAIHPEPPAFILRRGRHLHFVTGELRLRMGAVEPALPVRSVTYVAGPYPIYVDSFSPTTSARPFNEL
jgi:hypothetical protein